MVPRGSFAFAVGLVLAFAAGAARADSDADDYRQNCASCHTIGGGRLVGPDLKDVSKRQKKEWLVRFIVDPTGVLASGDPYATKLLAESRNVAMPPVAGMTARRAESLLGLIDAESKLEKSRFASSGVSERAFTPADVETGRALFRGDRALKAGGTACLACHHVGGVGGFGGGRLGPDLSDALARLGGRKALGAWLVAPPTPTMKPLFGAHPLDGETEVLPILAYLKDVSDAHVSSERTGSRVGYVLAGVALAAFLLVGMDVAWKGRFQGVRDALVRRGGRS
jgi:mono/diheme cytochrome c family protein